MRLPKLPFTGPKAFIAGETMFIQQVHKFIMFTKFTRGLV